MTRKFPEFANVPINETVLTFTNSFHFFYVDTHRKKKLTKNKHIRISLVQCDAWFHIVFPHPINVFCIFTNATKCEYSMTHTKLFNWSSGIYVHLSVAVEHARELFRAFTCKKNIVNIIGNKIGSIEKVSQINRLESLSSFHKTIFLHYGNQSLIPLCISIFQLTELSLFFCLREFFFVSVATTKICFQLVIYWSELEKKFSNLKKYGNKFRLNLHTFNIVLIFYGWQRHIYSTFLRQPSWIFYATIVSCSFLWKFN